MFYFITDIISFIQKINEELVLMARREISRITYELQSLPLVDEVGTIVKDVCITNFCTKFINLYSTNYILDLNQ